jgi:hypothetical protein
MNITSEQVQGQSNLRDEIRVSLLRLAQKNGGLRDLAGKAGLSYNALWGQINRGQGILADSIPPIVQATGDLRLLSLVADSCDCLIAPKPKYLRTRREIRKQETGLAIAVGQALSVIETALEDGLINSLERDEIRRALDGVCGKAVEIGAAVKEGKFLRRGK